jgi:DTW domain-containing protein YfiP
MNAFQRLRQQRLAKATKPFNARGGSISRCEGCGLPTVQCACELMPKGKPNAAFCLLMYDTEPMKPSNTGRLIADIFPDDTYAFLWSRTEVDASLLALINDPAYSPVVVFPESYVELGTREVISATATLVKKPLYILLDGTWSEARKMFRKSPYLDQFPVISVQPQTLSAYRLRVASHENQLCTAEVAGCLLQQQGDLVAASMLQDWFTLFRQRYLTIKPHHQHFLIEEKPLNK